MDQDQTFILWMPRSAAGYMVVHAVRLYTPETFFRTVKYAYEGFPAHIIHPNLAEKPRRLSRKLIKEMFSQFMDTPYAKAALKDERRNA